MQSGNWKENEEPKEISSPKSKALRPNISLACPEAIAIPQINCFSLILNSEAVKRRKETRPHFLLPSCSLNETLERVTPNDISR